MVMHTSRIARFRRRASYSLLERWTAAWMRWETGQCATGVLRTCRALRVRAGGVGRRARCCGRHRTAFLPDRRRGDDTRTMQGLCLIVNDSSTSLIDRRSYNGDFKRRFPGAIPARKNKVFEPDPAAVRCGCLVLRTVSYSLLSYLVHPALVSCL